MESWQTAASGILAFVAALATALYHQVDGVDTTQPNWNLVAVAFFAMLGLLRARDNKVSDEQAGAGITE